MRTGTVYFNGRNLNRMGKPTVRMERRPDPEPPAMATRQVFTFSLEFVIEKMSASGVHAVAREFDKVFSKSEGILRLEDETGYVREWLVAVRGGKPNDPLRGTANTYAVEMTAYVPLEQSEQMGHGATFLPSGGTLVHLHALRELSEVVTTDRHYERVSARKMTTTTINFTARVFHADQALSHAERMAQLQGVAAQYRSMNAKDGVLTMPGHNTLVQVQEWRPVIDERREILEIVVQCRRFDLPGEEQCETNLTRSSNLDVSTGEMVTSLRGSIMAEEKETALARMNAIKRSGMNAGSRLTKFSHNMPELIGADSDYETEWGGTVDFEMEYRTQNGQCMGYEIKIASERESNGGAYRRTYSGFVTAATLSAAEAKARDLGWNKHPRWTRSSEVSTEVNATTLNASGTEECVRTFTRLEFTYEYELVPEFLEAEFTMTRNKPSYGDRTASISGNFIASDRTTADAFQELVIPSLIPDMVGLSPIEREGRITGFTCQETSIVKQNIGSVSVTMIRRSMDFSVRVFDRGGTAHLKYSRSETINYTNFTSDVSASGSVWADNEAIARSAYAALKASMSLGVLSQEKITVDIERVAGQAENMVVLNFEAQGQSNVSETPGIDITEAQWSLSRTGQINHAILTEIPKNRPIAQTNMGWTVGILRVQGSVRAKSQASARAWAQAKLSLVLSGNGPAYETTPPEETLSPTFLANSDTQIVSWTFQFAYSRSYTRGLEGIWPS